MGFEDSTVADEKTSGAGAPVSSSALQGVMSLREVVDELKRSRKILMFAVLIALGLATIYLFISPTRYVAFVKVAPVAEQYLVAASSGGMQSLGLNMGRVEFDDFQHFIETLTSVKLAERLERDEQLSKRIFAYDKEAEEFIRPKGPIDLLKDSLNWIFGQPGWTEPSNHELANYLKSRFIVEQERDARVITISYVHGSRSFAEELLSISVQTADAILREEEKARNAARHGHLERRLAAEVRQTTRTLVSKLLLDAEQRLMLATVDPAFGARVIDGPTSASKPYSPNVLINLLFAAIVGFMTGVAVIVIRLLMSEDSG